MTDPSERSAAVCGRAADVLGPDGPLARTLEGYEVRAGQLEMAAHVERALKEDRILLCEAGTGTGKTLAYLIPAVLSGRKVVVSTATRALQEQIVNKDLPLIARVLGVEPRAAVMKGLANYVCLRRYHAFRSSPEADRPRWASPLAAIERWTQETETGDVSELAAIGEEDPILAAVTSSSDTRVGASCRYFDECFVTRMKRAAEAARIVIVNHHLFFADLALRGPHPGRVIPDYDAVIFDEAHQLEDIATAFFGVRVSSTRIDGFCKELQRALARAGLGDPLLSRERGPALVEAAKAASQAFFASLSAGLGPGEDRAVVERDSWVGERQEAYHALDSALEALGALSENVRGRLGIDLGGKGGAQAANLGDAFDVAVRRAATLREDLSVIVEGAPGRIAWFEAQARGAALSSSPVDVASLIRERVFESIPSVVMTSATLASSAPSEGSDPFRFLRSRLGLDDEMEARSFVVPSPFDFEKNALLYAPDDLPEPGARGFSARAVERIAELVELSTGGAFVLTTSLRAMRSLRRGLDERLRGYRVMMQGDAPKGALISAFRAGGDAVLVATMSFWQGVDVPGRALRLVVLDKIPFPVPTDPIIRARSQAIESAGGNPFMDLHVPVAQIALKQGFGRLIRTRNDYGIVALLDARVHRKGYGRRLLRALPPARVVRDMASVHDFWTSRVQELGSSDEARYSGPTAPASTNLLLPEGNP